LTDPIIGHRLFTDESARPVYLDPDRCQYVREDDGNRIFGAWLKPGEDGPDLPVIVKPQNGPVA
jgi:hypothetical protein